VADAARVAGATVSATAAASFLATRAVSALDFGH
jgi:hypothetical protein